MKLLYGKDMPVFVYGPRCSGNKEMIVIQNCQVAEALGIWNSYKKKYDVYSPGHGSGGITETESYKAFLNLTGTASKAALKAAF